MTNVIQLHNIEWYNDKDLSIFFDKEPDVHVRYPSPEDDTLTRNSKIRFPFENKRKLWVTIYDHKAGERYCFSIEKGYCYDGATIPRFLWRLIGSKSDPQFLVPALVHDVLCEHHYYIDDNRNLSSRVFRGLLIAGGVNKAKAQIMYLAVDNFQRLCSWDASAGAITACVEQDVKHYNSDVRVCKSKLHRSEEEG